MPDTDYRFSIVPWNISEGRDSYGPETRPLRGISRKIDRFAEAGFDAVMFHDDDVVPDIDAKTSAQVIAEARQRCPKPSAVRSILTEGTTCETARGAGLRGFRAIAVELR